jgi:hypothetical protein
MASLHHDRGVDIFVFHDDNFFLPRHEDSLARIHALADALAARRVGRIGTVVKARPNDVTREILQAMRDRLGCIRVFLGIENDSAQGQSTLNRQLSQEEHARALEVASELGIYVCFNMLIFDPDTTLASLEENLAFMLRHAESPWNFGRVELYAGTPLLARLQAEGACRGNYLGWDYRIADPAAQRVFELGMPAFIKRNFAPGALANRLGGTRFDVEVARHFHPERFRPAWLERSRELSRALGTDTVATLREVVAHVAACGPEAEAGPLAEELPARLRRVERELRARASALEREVQETIGACCRHVKLPTRLAPSLR